MTWSRRVLTLALLYLTVSAVIGGSLLFVDATGGALHLDVRLLRGTAFVDYTIPGLVLVLVGVGAGIAAIGAYRRRPWGPIAAIGMGIVLLLWITIQGSLIGFRDPLQVVHLLLGLTIILLGLAWLARDPSTATPAARQ